jgi:plastocyanin
MRATNRMLLLWALVASAPLSAATFDVQVLNFRYQPNDLQIQPGDTVRWTNTSGIHDVRADDGSFTNGGPSGNFTYSRTFNAVGQFPYYCTVHSAPGLNRDTAMNGIVRVVAGTPPFTINQGHSGAWFEPATAGQGFLIDISPAANFIFLAWFTYQAPVMNKVGVPEHRWLSAQGTYTGDSATNIPISQTAGGAFDTPRSTTTTAVGTMTIRFTSCTVGTITYTLTEGLSGEIPIQRLLPNDSLCTMLNTQ